MERIKANPHVAGFKQTRKAIENGTASLVFVARDADSHVVFPLERLCEAKGIAIEYVNNMKELAKACRVEVPTAVAAILGKDA